MESGSREPPQVLLIGEEADRPLAHALAANQPPCLRPLRVLARRPRAPTLVHTSSCSTRSAAALSLTSPSRPFSSARPCPFDYMLSWTTRPPALRSCSERAAGGRSPLLPLCAVPPPLRCTAAGRSHCPMPCDASVGRTGLCTFPIARVAHVRADACNAERTLLCEAGAEGLIFRRARVDAVTNPLPHVVTLS